MSEYYKAVEIPNMQSGTKAIVTIPAWAQALHEGTEGQKDTINTPVAAYAYVPLIFRATRLVCNSLIAAPVRFYKGKQEVDFPFPEISIEDLLWKSQAAMSLVGANYVEKILRSKSGKPAGVKWVNPTTMSVKLIKQENGKPVYEFQQGSNVSGVPGATFSLANMIYMREFTLREDVGPGDSSAKVSLNDAALLRYMSRFAARFFESGAMPVSMVSIEGLVDKDEVKRVEGFFKKAMTGLRNAFRVLAVSRQIESKVISQPVKDLVIPDLANQARRSVADAFDMHPSLLDEAPNMATAQEHRLSLYEDSVKPRAKVLVNEFNRQLFAPMGIEMKICFEEMDIFQEDEKEKAASVEAYTRAIAADPEIAIVVMDMMGVDFDEKERAALEKIVRERKGGTDSGKETATPNEAIGDNVQQQALNGAQVASLVEILQLVSQGQIPRDSGISVITASFPISHEEAERMMGDIGNGFEPEQVVASVSTTPPNPKQEKEQLQNQPPAKVAWADDLARWERKALRVLKESGVAVCNFESVQIPQSTREIIEAGLSGCKTAEEIKRLFDVRPTTQTPAPEYKSDPNVFMLADSINNLAAIYAKSLAVTPQPNINVTLPPITMTAQLPQQAEPSITFAPVIEQPVNNIEVKTADPLPPVVNVNVPEQAPPQVTVNVPEQAAPVVNNEVTVQPADVKIDIPKPKRERQKVKRNKQGFIESTDTQIEYEDGK